MALQSIANFLSVFSRYMVVPGIGTGRKIQVTLVPIPLFHIRIRAGSGHEGTGIDPYKVRITTVSRTLPSLQIVTT